MIINCNDEKTYSQPTLREVIEGIKNGKFNGEIMIFDTTLHKYPYYPQNNEYYASKIRDKKKELEELLQILLENNPGNVEISRIIVHPSLQRENNKVADDPQNRAPEELRPLFYKIQRAAQLKTKANEIKPSHNHDKYNDTKKIILTGWEAFRIFAGPMNPTGREDYRISNNLCGDRFGIVSNNITFDTQCINQPCYPVNKADTVLLCPRSQEDLESLLKTMEWWKTFSSVNSIEMGIAKLSTETFIYPTGKISFVINRDQKRGPFLADLEAKIPSLAKAQAMQHSNSLNIFGIFGTRNSLTNTVDSVVNGYCTII